MKRYLVLGFGLFSYTAFLAVFLYMIGFLGDFGVPKTIDSPAAGPLVTALVVDLMLIALFAVQHSIMARPWFKRRLMRVVPAPLERSTYVLASSVALALLFWQWRPLDGTLWNVAAPSARAAIYALFGIGWLTILAVSFLIDHFDLFGLRQVWLYFRGQEYTPLEFKTPGPYRFIRHPLYIGWLLAIWATPTMTMVHMLLALGMTGYILAAIPWEERDLIAGLGEDYAAYRRRVPRLLPRIGQAKPS